MSRGDWIHGSTITKTGELRYASVSSIDLADAANEGCPRKYAYKYIEKIKEPESDKQRRGINGHACVENYLATGSKAAISPDVAPGLFFVPEPGADLLIEWDLLLRPGVTYPTPLTAAHSHTLLSEAPLKLAGVPLLGYIDCIHARGTNKGGVDVEDTADPPNTVEVIDWKFVGTTKWCKKKNELVKMTQLASYAEWAWNVRPTTDRVRVSLGYYPEKGRAHKVTTLATREQVRPQIEHATGVVRMLQHIAKEKDASHVDGNTSACEKFGGCYYKKIGKCDVPMRKSLEMLVGKTMADEVSVPWNSLPPGQVVPHTQERLIPVASLLARTGVQAQVSQPATVDVAALAAEKARIAAEEAKARLASRIPAGFVEACAAIRSYSKGFPTLRGAAAMVYAASGGQDVTEGTEFRGTGDISWLELDDPAMLIQLVDDLKADAEANPVSVLPPDAPASDPTLAATQPEEQTTPTAEATAPAKRRKKSTPAAQNSIAQTSIPTQPTQEAETPEDDSAIHVYVDCATTHQTQDLNAWAQALADSIAKAAGTLDIRLGDGESAIGYGKWPGVLMSLARDPARAPLPGGHYTISTRYSAILETVASALEIRARESGGSFTRGVR